MSKFIFILMAFVYLSGCAATKTKGQAYPKMYSEKPSSIVVVPAINNTTAADATALYSTTIAQPLSEAGFYVVPVPYVFEMLALEGIHDGAQVRTIPAHKFKTLFGADSILFVTINQWDTNYFLNSGNVTVGLKFELVSTTSNDLLWGYDSVIVQDTSSEGSGNFIVDAITTAIVTATTDYIPLAKAANARIISTLPVGKYHRKFGMDGEEPGTATASF